MLSFLSVLSIILGLHVLTLSHALRSKDNLSVNFLSSFFTVLLNKRLVSPGPALTFKSNTFVLNSKALKAHAHYFQ